MSIFAGSSNSVDGFGFESQQSFFSRVGKLGDPAGEKFGHRSRERLEQIGRRRVVAVVGAMALSLALVNIAPWALNRVQGNPVDIPDGTEQYVVQPGDTAEDIAESYGLPGNPATLVDAIQQAAAVNDRDPDLDAFTTIVIPDRDLPESSPTAP